MDQKKIKVLISPKNLEEARVVIQSSDVSYVDCKNPEEGSLGANFPWVIKSMKKLISKKDNHFLLSATIGDFPYLPGSASLAALGAAHSGADIIKVGLMGPKNEAEGAHLMKNVVKTVKSYDPNIKTVTAGYADYTRMKSSPKFMEIPEIAAKSGSDIAMLDTFIKDGKGLFDFLNVNELIKFKENAKSFGLEVALAGNLKLEDIPSIKKIGPDIIGVRSVVCEGYDRNKGTINSDLVKNLMREINY